MTRESNADDLRTAGSLAKPKGDVPGSLAPTGEAASKSQGEFLGSGDAPVLITPPSPEERACHEAGHAVVAWAQGWSVTGVALTGGAAGLGETNASSVPPYDQTDDYVRHKLGGGVAVAILRGTAYDQTGTFGDADDLREIDRRFVDAGVPPDARSAKIRALADEAAKLLRLHSREHGELTAELRAKGRLNVTEVAAVLGVHAHACWQ
jgi:hypothetical protein